MDPKTPNEDERKKLQKMAGSFKLTIINIICLSGIYWIVRYFLNQYPVLQIAIYLTVLIAIFYLLLKMVLLNKCPRCSAWGAPIIGGNCARCGLYLGQSRKEH